MPNLATLMVGLGYDLSALQKGAPEAYALINRQTEGMSAEMKRTASEGAEAFRSLDEMLGIHINRPMTRMLVDTFPRFGKALADAIGGVAFGAVAFAGYELFERMTTAAHQAQKAMDDLQASTRKSADIYTDVTQAYAKFEKMHALTGVSKELFKIDSGAMEEARKQIDDMGASFEKTEKQAQEAASWTNHFLVWLGNTWHELSTAPTELHAEALEKTFAPVLQTFDTLSKLDALEGTRKSAKFITDQLIEANEKLNEMNEHQLTSAGEFLTNHAAGVVEMAKFSNTLGGLLPQPQQLGFSQAEIEQQTKFRDLLLEINKTLDAAAGKQKHLDNDARNAAATAAMEKQRAAIQAAAEATQRWADNFVKAHAAAAGLFSAAQMAPLRDEWDKATSFHPEPIQPGLVVPGAALLKDQFAAFDDAVRQADIHYTALYKTFGEQGFYFRFHESLQQVIADMRELAGEKLAPPEMKLPAFTGTAVPGLSPTAPTMPTLGAGGMAAAQFDAFQKNLAAQLKTAADAYQQIVTPQQKYQLAQQELNLLLEKGLIDQTAFNGAMQKTNDDLIEAAGHIQQLQEKLDKLLSHSDSARAGVQAFYVQLELDSAQNGRAAFDLLNQGLKGFEDELTKAVFTGKAKWEDMFRSMGESAFKLVLNKDIAGFFQMISGTGLGKSMGLGGLIPGGGAGGGKLEAASMTLQTGSTMLLSASTALQTAAATMSLGGTAAGANPFSFIPGLNVTGAFAGGTDSAPGGMAWVGEQGPELVNLPSGASVTPGAAVRGGGDQHFYIDAKGAEIGVEDKIVRALAAARPRIIGEAVANFSEIQRRSVQKH